MAHLADAAFARPDEFLYRRIASEIRRLIEAGTFKPGQRVPSVRRLAQQKRVSVTTVLEAYRILEDGGWIEARPQSGYYVRARLLRPPAEPVLSSPPEEPRSVGTRGLMFEILRDLRNPDMIHLGAALLPPSLMPSEKLNRALARYGRRSGKSAFEPVPGSYELRAEVARRAMSAGCSLTPDQVVITNGCQEAIVFALQSICRPGDTVAVESPTYYGHLQALEAYGLRVVEIATCPRDGMDLECLEKAVERHSVRAVIASPTFSNPLGARMSDEKKETLVDILAQRGIPLIEDDVNGDLGHEPHRPRSAKAWDRKGLVLLCSSFTKTLAPGYRIGWIAPGRYLDSVEYYKVITNLATASLPQLAVADFLANGGYDRHLRRIRRECADRVALMTQCVAETFPAGTRVTRPSGGFVLWVEMPAGSDALDLYEKAVRQGISFAPGPMFSAKGAYRNCIRLNAGRWSDRVCEALKTLGRMSRA